MSYDNEDRWVRWLIGWAVVITTIMAACRVWETLS